MTEITFTEAKEADLWTERNCTKCTRRDKCDIFTWIKASWSLRGNVPYGIARRMGFYTKEGESWFCKERNVEE